MASMASLSVASAQDIDPDTWDVPEEKWEIVYDLYQSVLDDNPAYRDLSHSVTVKRKDNIFYIKGIFEEYPDAWILGKAESGLVSFEDNQKLSQSEDNPAYMGIGDSWLVTQATNDREYTIGVCIGPNGSSKIWYFGDSGNDHDALRPSNKSRSIWIGSKHYQSWSIARTYYFDAPATGSDFDPLPVYRYPRFHRVRESGIRDNVIDEQRPEDTRVFDLNGRQVNPDRLTPGIYIRAGRKFIVR